MEKMYGEDGDFVLLRGTVCDRHLARQGLLLTRAVKTFWILQLRGARRSFSFHHVLNYVWVLYWQPRLINILQASLRSWISHSISPVLLSSHSHSLGECFFFIHFYEQVRKYGTLITGSKCRCSGEKERYEVMEIFWATSFFSCLNSSSLPWS